MTEVMANEAGLCLPYNGLSILYICKLNGVPVAVVFGHISIPLLHMFSIFSPSLYAVVIVIILSPLSFPASTALIQNHRWVEHVLFTFFTDTFLSEAILKS